ncbi:MAG: OmpA family protein [Actinomycetota bacterium]
MGFPSTALGIETGESELRVIQLTATGDSAEVTGFASVVRPTNPGQLGKSVGQLIAALNPSGDAAINIVDTAGTDERSLNDVLARLGEMGLGNVDFEESSAARERAIGRNAVEALEGFIDCPVPQGLIDAHPRLAVHQLAPAVGAALARLGLGYSAERTSDEHIAVWVPASGEETEAGSERVEDLFEPTPDPEPEVTEVTGVAGGTEALDLTETASLLAAAGAGGQRAAGAATPEAATPATPERPPATTSEPALHEPEGPPVDGSGEAVVVVSDPSDVEIDLSESGGGPEPGEPVEPVEPGEPVEPVETMLAPAPSETSGSRSASTPAHTYRRRRLFALLLVLLTIAAIVLLVLLLGRGGDDSASEDADPALAERAQSEQDAAQTDSPSAEEPDGGATSTEAADEAEAADDLETGSTADAEFEDDETADDAEESPDEVASESATPEGPDNADGDTQLALGQLVPLSALPERGAVFRADEGLLYLEGPVTADEGELLVARAVEVLGIDRVVNNYIVRPDAPPVTEGNVRVEQAVLFELGSEDVTEQFLPTLELGVLVMTLNPQVTMVVEGHTDDIGTEEDNLALSERRAQAVVDYLVAQGIERDRMTPIGRGESEPIAENDSEEGRSRNRRIEVNLVDLLADRAGAGDDQDG